MLVLSQYVEAGYAMELLSESAEGVGYLLKDRVSDVDDFAPRCGASPRAAPRSIRPSSRSSSAAAARDDPLGELTPREREVLELMAEGRSNQAIADQLVVTERAVEKHVTSIFWKLRLPGRRPRTTAASSPCSPYLQAEQRTARDGGAGSAAPRDSLRAAAYPGAAAPV